MKQVAERVHIVTRVVLAPGKRWLPTLSNTDGATVNPRKRAKESEQSAESSLTCRTSAQKISDPSFLRSPGNSLSGIVVNR